MIRRSHVQIKRRGTVCAKVLRWGLLPGLSNGKETSVAGSELGSERLMGVEEGWVMQDHGMGWITLQM